MATSSAHAVAAELRRRLPGIGRVKLHKLLYYSQGHHLAAFEAPLFEATISAWDMGPVVGTLWRQERQGILDGGTDALGEAELNTIGYVISRYGALSGIDLQHLTHGERPWQEANSRRSPGKSVKISVDTMRDYFASASTEDSDDGTAQLDADSVADWLSGAVDRAAEPARRDSVEDLVSRLGLSI